MTLCFSFLSLLPNSLKIFLFLKTQLLKSLHGYLQIFLCSILKKLNSYLLVFPQQHSKMENFLSPWLLLSHYHPCHLAIWVFCLTLTCLRLILITFLPSSNLVFFVWKTTPQTYSWPNHCSQSCYVCALIHSKLDYCSSRNSYSEISALA